MIDAADREIMVRRRGRGRASGSEGRRPVQPQTRSSLGRRHGAAAWWLASLALAGCGISPPGFAWPNGTSDTGEATSTWTSTEGEGEETTGSPSSETGATETGATETGEPLVPDEPVLALELSQVKHFDFHWDAVEGATYYRLLESPSPGEPFATIEDDIRGESIPLVVSLHSRYQARYQLEACNEHGCTSSEPIEVVGSLATAIGYFKASNAGASDLFGHAVALSGDGNTLAVGASGEDGGSTGIDGDPSDESAVDSGAVYVFARDRKGKWAQQAYVKASNTGAGDQFGAGFRGRSLALSGDGSTLVVGAWAESHAGVDAPPILDAAYLSGAAYVFVRDPAGQWSQEAYLKASNLGALDLFGAAVTLSRDGDTLAIAAPYEDGDGVGPRTGAVYVLVRKAAGQWVQQAILGASNPGENDEFGHGVALSGDGDTLAVGAPVEASGADGIDGDQADDSAFAAGAVYVFVRDPVDQWSQQAYVKASNPDPEDRFGWSLALDLDGDTLAVGAPGEASDASRVDGPQDDDSSPQSGAAYVFVRDPMHRWSQQAYVKASNSDSKDSFGQSVALRDDGDMLAVSAHYESSPASGIGGDETNDSSGTAGAVYVLVRNSEAEWSQRAYVKSAHPSVIPLGDRFGWSVALSGDGGTLAVGSPHEDSDAKGIGGDPSNELRGSSGAVHLY
jgi:hypothetical protein